MTGLYVHAAVLELVRDQRVRDLLLAGSPVGDPPAGLVQRKDGMLSAHDWLHPVQVAKDDPLLAAELDRAWFVSAPLVLGDRLAAEDYFDRAPLLEMVRHLRNGVGHTNRFEICDPRALLGRLAHRRNAACRSQTGLTFETAPDLYGNPVLFDFMGPVLCALPSRPFRAEDIPTGPLASLAPIFELVDVLDVLISVGTYLLRQRQGLVAELAVAPHPRNDGALGPQRC